MRGNLWMQGCAVVLSGGLSATALAQSIPIAATGWNRDIVVEASALAPFSTAAMPLDTTNNLAFYERTLPSSTKGLPSGGSFACVADPLTQVQLQPYDGLNALFLNAGTMSGTLTFALSSQTEYDALTIVATSTNGGGLGSLVITFTDASVSNPIAFSAWDWFSTPTVVALNDIGRANLSTSTIDDGTAGQPRLHATVINLASLGLNDRSIASITLTMPMTANTTAGMAISGQRSLDAVIPIGATGWNRDIVVESSASAPFSGFASNFDTGSNFAWYEQGLVGTTKGLPAGGTFYSLSSSAIQVQLQPYTGPNALFLNSTSPTGTLTLDAPSARAYERLAVFASSANQGGLGTMTIGFSDSTTTPAIQFNAQDWFNVTANNAQNNLGRVNLNTNAIDDGSAGNPRIYQTVIDLAALGYADRTVTSITFTKPAVGGTNQSTVIMAMCGQISSSGACTQADGICTILLQTECTGSFAGAGSTCPPLGACIAANGGCTIRSEANCAFAMGVFNGPDSTCPLPGACIAANGDCTQLTIFQCAVQSGVFLSQGTPCPELGGCCGPDGCSLRNSFQCAFIQGSFLGEGTSCVPARVEVTPGVAFEDISTTGTELSWFSGTSDEGTTAVALGFSFEYFGAQHNVAFVSTNGFISFDAGPSYASNTCPLPNPASANNALFPLWDDYHIGTSTFMHPGRVYTQTLSSPTRFIVQWNRVGQYNIEDPPMDENTFQIAMFESGRIEFRYGAITTMFGCDASVGIENADGSIGLNFDNTLLGNGNTALTITIGDPCSPESGVCCRGGTCSTIVAQADCAPSGTAGAVFMSTSSTCNDPGDTSTPCCHADYNKTSGVTVQDIFDFLADYFSGSSFARVSSDGAAGAPSVQSIFDFLAAYFGGCP